MSWGTRERDTGVVWVCVACVLCGCVLHGCCVGVCCMGDVWVRVACAGRDLRGNGGWVRM